jgi:tRNA(fMet)-specific endonuclease VapC
MRYVLDTNIVSALMRPEAAVLLRLKRTNRREVLVPQPVLAEIAYGIARLPKSRRKQHLKDRFDLVVGTLARIDWTDSVSLAFGAIKAALERKGRRIEDFDIAVAAHALANDATLVTTNVKHMAGVPDLLIEDWRAPTQRRRLGNQK